MKKLILCLFFFSFFNNLTLAEIDHQSILEQTTFTFGIYKAIYSAYLNEGINNTSRYSPDFLLKRAYINTFLNEWEKSLLHHEVQSTAEYFQRIKAGRHSFISKYYNIWEEFDAINLGNYRKSILLNVLHSEFNNSIDDRVISMLSLVASEMLIAQTDINLGMSITHSFIKYPNEVVKKIAIEALNYRFISPTLYNSSKYALLVSASLVAIFPGKISKILKNGSVSLVEYFSELKPFSNKFLSPLQKSLLASLGVHAGAVGISDYQMQQKKILLDPRFKPISRLLCFTLLSESVESTSSKFNDFDPSFVTAPLSKDDIYKLGEDILLTKNTSLVGKFLFWSEFYHGLKEIKNKELYSDFILKKYQELQRYWPSLITKNVRQEVISSYLGEYRKDQRLMRDFLWDYGGNCVAQTLLLVDMYSKYPNFLPKNTKLGIALTPTHMEAVAWGNGEVIYLVSGKKFSMDTPQTILSPLALVAYVMSNKIPITNKKQYYILNFKNDFLGSGKIDSKAGIIGDIVNVFPVVTPTHREDENPPEYAHVRYVEIDKSLSTELHYNAQLESSIPSFDNSGMTKTTTIAGQKIIFKSDDIPNDKNNDFVYVPREILATHLSEDIFPSLVLSELKINKDCKLSFLTDAPVTIWTSEHVACLHSLRKVGWNFYLNHPVLNRVFGDSFMPNKNIGIYGPHMPYLKYHLRNWYLLEYLSHTINLDNEIKEAALLHKRIFIMMDDLIDRLSYSPKRFLEYFNDNNSEIIFSLLMELKNNSIMIKLPLRDYLNSLSSNAILVVKENNGGTQVPFEVHLPYSSTNIGVRREDILKGQQNGEINISNQKIAKKNVVEKIKLTPKQIIYLTLFSGGGIGLWNDEVINYFNTSFSEDELTKLIVDRGINAKNLVDRYFYLTLNEEENHKINDYEKIAKLIYQKIESSKMIAK